MEKTTCLVCHMDLGHLTCVASQIHLNSCLDKQESQVWMRTEESDCLVECHSRHDTVTSTLAGTSSRNAEGKERQTGGSTRSALFEITHALVCCHINNITQTTSSPAALYVLHQARKRAARAKRDREAGHHTRICGVQVNGSLGRWWRPMLCWCHAVLVRNNCFGDR